MATLLPISYPYMTFSAQKYCEYGNEPAFVEHALKESPTGYKLPPYQPNRPQNTTSILKCRVDNRLNTFFKIKIKTPHIKVPRRAQGYHVPFFYGS